MASSGRSHGPPQRPSDRLPWPSSTHSLWPGSCEAGKPVQRVGADHRIGEQRFYCFCAFACCLASFLFLWCCTRAPPAAPAAPPRRGPLLAAKHRSAGTTNHRALQFAVLLLRLLVGAGLSLRLGLF